MSLGEGEGYVSKIPNFIKFDHKIFRVEESELQHDIFALKIFDEARGVSQVSEQGGRTRFFFYFMTKKRNF
jgi:hypothetical protein